MPPQFTGEIIIFLKNGDRKSKCTCRRMKSYHIPKRTPNGSIKDLSVKANTTIFYLPLLPKNTFITTN